MCCPNFTRTTIICILLNIFGGFLFGLNTGYVPSATLYTTELLNCTAYTSKSGCLSVSSSRSHCRWIPPSEQIATGDFCFFNDYPQINCSKYSFTSKETCTTLNHTLQNNENNDDEACHFDTNTKLCSHKVGWDALRQGLFAGSLIVGATIGSLAAGKFADKFGRKYSLIFLSSLSLASLVAEALCWQFDSFVGLVVSRVFIGISVGFVCVVLPLYSGEMMRSQTAADIIGEQHQQQQQSSLLFGDGKGETAGTTPRSARTPRTPSSNANFIYESVDDPRYLYSAVPQENDQSRFSETVGVIFQVCVTSGVFVTSLILLAIKIRYEEPDPFLPLERFHIFHIITGLDALAILIISSCFMKESSVWLEMDEKRREDERFDHIHQNHTSTSNNILGSPTGHFSDIASSVPSYTSPRQSIVIHDESTIPVSASASALFSAAAAAGGGGDINTHQKQNTPKRRQNNPSLVSSHASSLQTIHGKKKSTSLSQQNLSQSSTIQQEQENNNDCNHYDNNLILSQQSIQLLDPSLTEQHQQHQNCQSTLKVVALALTLAGILQFTGVNALLNFSPTIVKSLGLSPTIGNLIVLSLFWLTTLVTFPVSRYVKPWTAYLVSTICITVACVLLGLAMLNSLNLNGTETLVIGGIALVVYATAFHAGVGPFFFVLSQGVFPIHQRDLGCSLSMLFQFAMNVVINVSYPIAITEISGGSGTANKDKGLSVMFFVFAGFGLLGVLSFWKLAPKQLIRPK